MKLSLSSMKAATDLTRSGKLLEATALIQEMLSKDVMPQPQNTEASLWQQPKLAAAPDASLKRAKPEVGIKHDQFASKVFTSA